MSQKLLSQDDLRKKAEELISDSPVLAEIPEVKNGILESLESLSEAELQELLGLLNDEAADWKKYFDGISTQREKLITEANNSSLLLQKEAEKLIHGAEEEISEEKDSSRAEDLLKQL